MAKIKIEKVWRNTLFMLFLILFFGGILRVSRILVGEQPIFTDEAIYVRWAQVMKAEPTLRFLPLSDGKQPLFMWILMFLLQPQFNPLLIGRVLSAATGLLTNIGVFVLSYQLFKSKKVSLIATVIYATMPMALLFDSMALVDSMLAMFGVWATIFMIKSVKNERYDYSMMAGFSLGGALLTKSPALFYSLLLPLTYLLRLEKSKDSKILISTLKTFVFFIPMYLIGYAMYNVMRLGPNFHLISSRNSDYVFPISHIWESPFDPLLVHLADVANWFWFLGPGIVLILSGMGVYYGLKQYKKPTLFLLLFVLVPLFANSMYARVFTVRYVYFLIPYFIILSALFVGQLRRTKSQFVLLGLYIFASLYVNFLLIFNIEKAPLPKSERTGYLENWTAGYGIKEVADYLVDYHKTHPDEKIVVGTEGYFGTLPDGLQLYLNNYPEITIVGVGIDINELPSQLKESSDFGSKTFFVINSSRLLADSSKLGLQLIQSFPKPLRTVGTHEYVRYGERDSLLFFEVK